MGLVDLRAQVLVAEPELPSRLAAGWQLQVRRPTLQDMGQGADPAH